MKTEINTALHDAIQRIPTRPREGKLSGLAPNRMQEVAMLLGEQDSAISVFGWLRSRSCELAWIEYERELLRAKDEGRDLGWDIASVYNVADHNFLEFVEGLDWALQEIESEQSATRMAALAYGDPISPEDRPCAATATPPPRHSTRFLVAAHDLSNDMDN